MSSKNTREERRVYRHRRIRKKIKGTPERPRLYVHRSLTNFYAQIIDDTTGKTLLGCSTLSKDLRGELPNRGNKAAAARLGKKIAEEAKQRGISKVSFDRGGNLYHGRVKAFADAAREAGMEF